MGFMGKLTKRTYKRIYLGEWLDALGQDQKGTADAAGVNPSYISNIVSGRKTNPSGYVMQAIADHLEITMNDLYEPPPSHSAVAMLNGLSPEAREVLLQSSKRK